MNKGRGEEEREREREKRANEQKTTQPEHGTPAEGKDKSANTERERTRENGQTRETEKRESNSPNARTRERAAAQTRGATGADTEQGRQARTRQTAAYGPSRPSLDRSLKEAMEGEALSF